MKTSTLLTSPQSNSGNELDHLMATLLVLITHHGLIQCESTLTDIVDCLHKIIHHPEIELYPQQRKIIVKMQQLWHTRLFSVNKHRQMH